MSGEETVRMYVKDVDGKPTMHVLYPSGVVQVWPFQDMVVTADYFTVTPGHGEILGFRNLLHEGLDETFCEDTHAVRTNLAPGVYQAVLLEPVTVNLEGEVKR